MDVVHFQNLSVNGINNRTTTARATIKVRGTEAMSLFMDFVKKSLDRVKSNIYYESETSDGEGIRAHMHGLNDAEFMQLRSFIIRNNKFEEHPKNENILRGRFHAEYIFEEGLETGYNKQQMETADDFMKQVFQWFKVKSLGLSELIKGPPPKTPLIEIKEPTNELIQ